MSDRLREDGHSLAMLIGFWLAAVVDVAGEATGIAVFTVVTKPFLMLFLLVWAVPVLRKPKPRAGRYLIAGILFAWVGDVLLMVQGAAAGGLLFLVGLGCFLLMQVCYILAFLSVPGPSLLRRSWLLVLPFVLYWAVMNWRLHPGVLRLPVLVYSLVLLGMSVAALDLTPRLPAPYSW